MVGGERPALSPSVIPFVQGYTKQHASNDGGDLSEQFHNATDQLEANGIATDGQLAAAALIMWNVRRPKTAGAHTTRKISWGDRYPCVDYAAQELAVSNLHFRCIHMEFELPLGVHLRTASGKPCNLEKNQCVDVHIAIGLEWITQGRPRRAPSKSRVLLLAAHLWKIEYRRALRFTTSRHALLPGCRQNYTPCSRRYGREPW